MEVDHSESVPQHLAHARQAYAEGKLDDAEAHLHATLESDACHTEALHLLGYVCQAKGDIEAAETMMLRAVAFQPDQPSHFASLGDLYRWVGQHDLACGCYRNGLSLDEGHVASLKGLFASLNQSDKKVQAKEIGNALLERCPDDFETLHNVGAVSLSLGEFDDAIELLSRALAQHNDVSTREMLGKTFSLKGDSENAYRQYERILKDDPDHAIAAHHLAANSKDVDAVPSRAPDAYVERAFDEFAVDFDKTLSDLRYQGPSIIRHLLEQRLGRAAKQYTMLDLGCGTGLCGVELAPFCSQLIGVDLSQEMLKIAEKNQAYSKLVHAELGQFLDDCPDRFDAVVSADTLIYLGKLDTVFSAAARRLLPGGWLIATLEASEPEQSAPYSLKPSGRYVHNREYLQDSLANAGFANIEILEVHLRIEVGVPVEGIAVSAQLPKS